MLNGGMINRFLSTLRGFWPRGVASGFDAARFTPHALAQLSVADRRARLRALAEQSSHPDPEALNRTLATLTREMPEAGALITLYVRHRNRFPDQPPHRPPLAVDLDALQQACDQAQPLRIRYVDMNKHETEREVLPLLVVYPQTGIKLVAWCLLRDAPRTFFAHSMRDVIASGPPMINEWPALLVRTVWDED